MLDALRPIAEAIRARGGRAVVVGGFVRDRELGSAHAPKDADVEVFGLAAAELAAVLCGFGELRSYGRVFPVMRVAGLDADFVLPRGERAADPARDFASAARRRDLTINAIGLDPLSGEILDPLGGRADLAARVLRAADPRHFGDDPLRGLRVMQLAARFAMEPDDELLRLCAALDLLGIPAERLRVEFDKLLLRAPQPSRGLDVLRRTDLVRFFPELAALLGVPQDPARHPEGDVWVHTAMALDAAAEMRRGDGDDVPFMYAVLCHDFGKPAATRESAGRVRAHGHQTAGAAAVSRFLERLRAPNALLTQVLALVEHHLAPAQLPRDGASMKAYRRLARRLAEAGLSPALLERVARADHLGRATPDARARRFPEGDRFLAEVARLEVAAGGAPDAVLGRHLIARGVAPGPEFARLLARCREVQDETGWSDPDAILARALPGLTAPYRGSGES